MDMGFDKDKGPVMDRGQGFGVREPEGDVFAMDISRMDVSDVDVPEIEMPDMAVLDEKRGPDGDDV